MCSGAASLELFAFGVISNSRCSPHSVYSLVIFFWLPVSAEVHNLVYMVASFWFNDSIYGRARILARDGRLRIIWTRGLLLEV
jgi:hypothetical protein